ncbi:MAG: hypothetical protein HYX76_09885 [Acidobacteria bacterium]|nr:hypothetical protein [Acidobacteriota bacterium]
MLRTVLCLTFVAFTSTAAAALASEAPPDASPWTEMPVPGGITAFVDAFDLSPATVPGSLLLEIARKLYTNHDPITTLRQQERVRAYLAGLDPGAADAREVVPLLLSPEVWRRILRQQIDHADLFRAIATDRPAVWLYYGLFALDRETLRFLSNEPNLLYWIYREASGPFLAFGRSIKIRRGRIELPGAGHAEPLWRALFDRPTTPERFVRRLLTFHEGRLAYFYDSIAHLDRPHLAFALGTSIPDVARRIDRFGALYAVFAAADAEWNVNAVPFARPPFDPALALHQLQVVAPGRLGPPALRGVWESVFDDADPSHVGRGGDADAAWMLERICLAGAVERRHRYYTVLFGQRVFEEAPLSEASHVARILRAFPRRRALLTTLERIGIKNPRVYLSLLDAADRLTKLGPSPARSGVAGLQGTIAIIERARFARAIDVEQAVALLQALGRLETDDGGFGGRLTEWWDRELLPTLAAATGTSRASAETIVLSAIAGVKPGAASPHLVRWEEFSYRIDLAASELARLRHIREKQGGASLDEALDLARAVTVLRTSKRDAAGERRALADIESALSRARTAGSRQWANDALAMPLGRATRLMEHAGRAAGPASGLIEPLGSVADGLLAVALASVTYAAHIADPESPLLLTGDIAQRHDFGIHQDGGVRGVGPWDVPVETYTPGSGWRMTGALLGLEVGFPQIALRRLSDQNPLRPALNENDARSFAQSVALSNPYVVSDGDVSLIARAIAAGRQRVAEATSNAGALEELTRDADVNEWRRAVIGWTATHEPARVESLLSLAEVLRIGRRPEQLPLSTDLWGAASFPLDGCLCLRSPSALPVELAAGRTSRGLLGATIVDLNLHIVSTLAELGLPARLARGLLAVMTRDFVDQTPSSHHDDWLALVQHARSFTRFAMVDYIATLTAGGPLLPARDPAGDPR